jgi:hypothetical protein
MPTKQMVEPTEQNKAEIAAIAMICLISGIVLVDIQLRMVTIFHIQATI